MTTADQLSRAERLLAAADRVREASVGQKATFDAQQAAWGAWSAAGVNEPLRAAYVSAMRVNDAALRELGRAQRVLTAVALESGDSAWALGVLGAAVRVGEADGVHREERARATSLHYAGRPYDGPMLTEAERASLDAERALLAAARGAR